MSLYDWGERKVFIDAENHPSNIHFHADEQGRLQRCYHQCKQLLSSWQFWFGITITFPLEHYLWEKVPGFSHVTEWMGL